MEDIRRKAVSWADYKKRLEDRLRQEDSHSLGPKPITTEQLNQRKKQEEHKKQQEQKLLIKKKKKRGGRHVQFSKEARDLHRLINIATGENKQILTNKLYALKHKYKLSNKNKNNNNNNKNRIVA